MPEVVRFWENKLLFIGQDVAMHLDCCCPGCSGCFDTQPPYLKWTLGHYVDTCVAGVMRCLEANGSFILEHMSPQPNPSPLAVALGLNGPGCAYLYESGTPWSHGADGWIAELYEFDLRGAGTGGQKHILVYQNGGTQMGDTDIQAWDADGGGAGWEFYRWRMGGADGWQDSCYDFLRCDDWDIMGNGNDAIHNKLYDRQPPCSGQTNGQYSYIHRALPAPDFSCCADSPNLAAKLEPWFLPVP